MNHLKYLITQSKVILEEKNSSQVCRHATTDTCSCYLFKFLMYCELKGPYLLTLVQPMIMKPNKVLTTDTSNVYMAHTLCVIKLNQVKRAFLTTNNCNDKAEYEKCLKVLAKSVQTPFACRMI